MSGGDAGGAQTGKMTDERWHTSYEQLKSLGILAQPFDVKQTYTLQFAH